MKTIEFTVTLLSPLVLGKERQARTPGTTTIISGTTLRGLIARAYLSHIGSADNKDFTSLVLSEENCFPFLFPVTNNDAPSLSLPLTALSCKRYPGFLSKQNSSFHGVRDGLFMKGIQELSSKSRSSVYKKLSEYFVCSCCGNDLAAFEGYWNGSHNAPKKANVTLEFRMHVGINRTTGTAEEGKLYGTEFISPYAQEDAIHEKSPIKYSGVGKMTDTSYDLLEQLLKCGPLLSLGADRTRGYGKISLECRKVTKSSNFNDFSRRINEWSNAFSKAYKKTCNENTSEFYISLNFITDTILIDRYLRYSCNPDMPEYFSIITAILRQKKVRGWNTVWRLPKEDEIALQSGSVILYRIPSQKKEEALKFLYELKNNSLGVRREEGFGMIEICDDFHKFFYGGGNNG